MRHSSRPNDTGWLCGDRADWETARVEVTPTIAVSNFLFEEETSVWTRMEILRIQFVTVNKASEARPFNAQFVGFDHDGAVTLAVSVAPVLDRVNKGLETLESETYVRGRVLPGTTRVCAAFVTG